jgi:hypothetical protein
MLFLLWLRTGKVFHIMDHPDAVFKFPVNSEDLGAHD